MTSSANNNPVDWDEFAAQLGGDAELIEMLREMFLEYVDGQLERLGDAVAKGDARRLLVPYYSIELVSSAAISGLRNSASWTVTKLGQSSNPRPWRRERPSRLPAPDPVP